MHRISYHELHRICYAFYLVFNYLLLLALHYFLTLYPGGTKPGQRSFEESINALPTYNFKTKKDESGATGQTNSVEGGGIVAMGTEKERIISGEDAICCICLSRYMDDDELRELPCSQFFHGECVDRLLKISATCPLCKYEILEREETPPSAAPSTQEM